MSRVSAAWSITNRVVQPAAMALWGVLALASSTRIAIGLAGAGLVLSCAFLPWRRLWREQLEPAGSPPVERQPAGSQPVEQVDPVTQSAGGPDDAGAR